MCFPTIVMMLDHYKNHLGLIGLLIVVFFCYQLATSDNAKVNNQKLKDKE